MYKDTTDVESLYEGGFAMRFLKAVVAAVVTLFVLTALSHYVLNGGISPSMAGFGGAVAGIVTWWLA